MERILGAVLAVIFVASASVAHAIKIKTAEVRNGVAVVQGTKAAAGADIFWEGAKVTQANKGGHFSFSGIIPADCVGTLSDGTSIEVVVLDCTPAPSAPAPVAKTAQTECINEFAVVINCAGTGQDGELQKGVEWPNPRFTAGGDGTVTDNLTGLIWLQDANCIASAGIALDGLRWQDAFDFVTGINNRIYDCGDRSNGGNPQSDWRMPNVRELASLVDYGRLNPSLPSSHLFLNLQVGFSGHGDAYWSSTTRLNDRNGAWVLGVGAGDLIFSNKANVGHVLAVRGGR